jgi:hypothetical protein
VGEFPARVTCSGSICLGFRFEMEIFADQRIFLQICRYGGFGKEHV